MTWAVLFSLLSQLIVVLMPGKDFPDLWICSGNNPTVDQQIEQKSVAINQVIEMFSFIIHISIAIRIKIYNWKFSKENLNNFHPRSKIYWVFSMDSNTVVDTAEGLVPFIIMIVALSLNFFRGSFDLELLNSYPLCLKEYFHTLIRPVLTALLMVVSQLAMNKKLRNIFKSELRDWLNL